MYINCVYFGENAFQHFVDDAKTCPEAHRGREADEWFEALISIYVLVDKLKELAISNIVIDKLIRLCDILKVVPTDQMNFVYTHTSPNSPLRKLLRDCWIHEMDHATSLTRLDECPRGFLEDVAAEFVRIQSGDDTRTIDEAFKQLICEQVVEDACRYHQHDDKHPKCTSKSKSTSVSG